MENFILYEEIGRGKYSIVYKGRRKGTIKFLAILCIEKSERAAITNWVRLVHEVEHENIVKFYEWYETSNHLWMVVELCTGGLLQEILNQDGFLPEKTICKFGKDILNGLDYLHERGIIFADLCPKKVLLDGPGKLKLTNLCISRLQDENLEDIYMQAMSDDSCDAPAFNLSGSLEYQAPEVVEGKSPSHSSDIWSFGILLFQLYTGCLPSGSHETFESFQLEMSKNKRKFFLRQLPQDLKSDKPSDDFAKLIYSILQKQPEKRPTAQELLKHSFWNLYKDEITVSANQNNSSNSAAASGDSSMRLAVKNSVSLNKNDPCGKSGRRSITPETVTVLDSTFTLSSRPHTAISTNEEANDKASPPKSARMQTPSREITVLSHEKTRLMSTSSQRPSSAVSVKSIVIDSLVIHDDEPSVQHTTTTFFNVKEYIYHDSDFEFSVIQDNAQVRKVDPLKWEARSLPFQFVPSIGQLTPDDLYHHLKQVSEALNQPNSSNYVRAKMNVLVYLSHLCSCNNSVANYIINSNILGQLASIVRNSSQQSPDIASKACRTIGLAASCATELEQCTRISEPFSLLSESFRENFRNNRLKIALLPCIGQLMFLVAEQEDDCLSSEEHPSSPQHNNWSIPSVVYGLITKCLREGEDAIIQHFACKIIEAVTTVPGQHGKKFITVSSQGSSGQSHTDVIGPCLWTVASRANNENLKLAALTALCRLNKVSGTGAVFQAAVDRAGLAAFLSILSRASYRCQQAIVTSLVETLQSAPKGHAARLANGKDLLPSLMRLFDSPSPLVRTKIILAVLLMLKKIPTLIVSACQQRLVMYIERESRRVAVTSAGQTAAASQNDYTQSCLNLLIQHLSFQAPLIANNCIAILDETVVRKHPSSNQVKQLRQLLPTCTVLQQFVTSQIFRSQIVTSDFVNQLGLLLSHASIFFKKTSQSSLSSSIGDDIVHKFVDAVISVIECLSQHPLVLTQHLEASMTSLVPNIVALLAAYGDGDGQIVCIKLLTDVLGALLHYQAMSLDIPPNPSPATPLRTPPSRIGSAMSAHGSRNRCQDIPDEYGVRSILKSKLMPCLHSVLSSKDPLPAYGVRLLGTLLEFWPSLCADLHSYKLISILMTLFEKQSSNWKMYVQGVTTVLTYLVQYNDESILTFLYDKGLVEMLCNYVLKASKQFNKDLSGAGDANLSYPDTSLISECLMQLLSLMKAMLDRVTMFVKHTLQTQHASELESNSQIKNRTENAEKMLLDHKPLTELQTLCIQLLTSEHELHEIALACLSMLIQLYGGDHPDTMNASNMSCLAQTLSRLQPKRQRILLKLLKRVISLNKPHAESLTSPSGTALLQRIQEVYENAEKLADASVANLASDILKLAHT